MSQYNIINIHGVPRSGTSWLGQILESVPNVKHKWQPLYSNTFKNRITADSSEKDIYDFYDAVYNMDDEYLDRSKQRELGLYPKWENKTENPDVLVVKQTSNHFLLDKLLSSLDNFKAVAIIRNPCGSLNSFKNSPSEFEPTWNFEEEWKSAPKKNQGRAENYFGFEKWVEAVNLFEKNQKKFPDKLIIVKYEDLLNNPVFETKRLFDFFGLEYTAQTQSFIEESTSKNIDNIWSVFKGKRDGKEFEKDMDPNIIKEVYNLTRQYGLEKYL